MTEKIVSEFRARLGIIYPAPAIVAEREFYSVLPETITVCTTRVPLSRTTPDGLLETVEHACEAGKLLAQARVDVIGFLCTAGSLIRGAEFDQALSSKIKEVTGIETVTTAASAVEALHSISAKKVVVVTPYSQEINRLERSFLEAHGLEVLAIAGLDLTDPYQISQVTPTEIYLFSRKLWERKADALFISCTGIATFPIIDSLEEDIGKPVVTSNQASLWFMLKTARVNLTIPQRGLLLSGHPANPQK